MKCAPLPPVSAFTNGAEEVCVGGVPLSREIDQTVSGRAKAGSPRERSVVMNARSILLLERVLTGGSMHFPRRSLTTADTRADAERR